MELARVWEQQQQDPVWAWPQPHQAGIGLAGVVGAAEGSSMGLAAAPLGKHRTEAKTAGGPRLVPLP